MIVFTDKLKEALWELGCFDCLDLACPDCPFHFESPTLDDETFCLSGMALDALKRIERKEEEENVPN